MNIFIITFLFSFLFCQNQSLYFDGNDNIGIADDYRFEGTLDEFSISFWIKPTSFEGWGSVFLFRRHNLDNYLNIGDDGQLRFGLSTDNGYNAIYAQLSLNEWQHIVATFNNGEFKLYRDNVLISSLDMGSTSVDWDDECWFMIGGDEGISQGGCSGGYSGHVGYLDDVSIWSKELSTEDINQISIKIWGDEEALIHNYSFNENYWDGGHSNSPTTSYDIPNVEIHVPQDYSSIQQAINASNSGDSIFVASGTYFENINFNGKNISLIGEDRETTIIDGNGSGRVIEISEQICENCLITEFTLQNGDHPGGGGIYLSGQHVGEVSPLIQNLIIRNNNAGLDGGGLHSHFANPIIENVIFENNFAGRNGGAIHSNEGTITITNSTFQNNTSEAFGGGLHAAVTTILIENSLFDSNQTNSVEGGAISFQSNSNMNVYNSIFSYNSSHLTGGALYGNASNAQFNHCLFEQNQATVHGGAVKAHNSDITWDYCTFIDNQSDGDGETIFVGQGSSFNIINSIIAIDSAPNYDSIANDNASLSISNSNIEGGYSGSNIDIDPFFCDPSNSDFSLHATSEIFDYFEGFIGAFDIGCSGAIGGCLDSNACNYNPNSDWSDGSCFYDYCNGNYSLYFDGDDDYAEFGHNFDINSDFTISSWITPIYNEQEMDQTIFSKSNGSFDNGIALWWNPDGKDMISFRAVVEGSSGVLSDHTTDFPANVPYYVTMKFERNSSSDILKIFVNGVEAASTEGQVGNVEASNPFILGLQGHPATNNGRFYIESMEFWNIPLELEQISSYMNYSPFGNESNLHGLWKFDYGSGYTIYDWTGNNNNGFLNDSQDWLSSGCTDPLASNFSELFDIDNGTCTGSIVNSEDFTFAGSFDGSYYYISNQTSGWGEAHNVSINSGGDLVAIGSQVQNDFIKNLYISSAWIGFSQQSDIEPNEGWEWSNGEGVLFTNWEEGEPNNNGDEDCAEIYGSQGKWNDRPCSFNNRYIMKITYGCNDELACNYNNSANQDDGSCIIPSNYGWCDCDGNLPDQCGLCYGNNDCLTKINILALEDSGYIKNKLNEYGNSDFNILEFSDVCESCSALSELNFENAINQYDLDVIIFPNGVLASNWNSQDIFPPLTNFMNAGGQVILMQYNIMQWISNESSWFEPYLITEYNINNGTIAADDCHCLYNDIVFENIDINSHPIVSNIHDYGPNCSITTGDPYAYDLPQPLSNNFFGLVGWCGNTIGGADYGIGQEQIVGGRNIGNGEIILFGAGLPSWGTINLMGNIITHFQSELESILYLESQQIISGETTSIPIFLDKESAVDGLIFSIDVNSGLNEEIISMDMQFENGINGLFNYVNGMGSVVLSDLNSYNQGETILLGHIFIELPSGIPQGEQYYISIRNASGTDQNYELIDIIGYQNISFDVITAPPEYTGLSESYCLVEGEFLESSFQISDDLNMDISLEYDCPPYVDITFNEESHDGLISINSNFGDESGECTFTATTNDVIPEVTSLVIPININHYPTLGIGDGFNVVENELFTFEITPLDLDGDILTVEYLGGSDYVNLDGTTLSINPPFGSDNSEICFSLSDDGCPPIANQEFCYDVLINHQPLVNCDTDFVHIPETDIIVISCVIDDGGDSDIDQSPTVNQECSYVSSTIDEQNIILEIFPGIGDSSCILDLAIEDNTGLSNSTQIDVQVYKTYLVGDVRPQSDSELAGEFGDGIIVAPDVVNILKVATGVAQSPTLDSDLFDAFDSSPQDIDIDDDGDLFDQSERGGDQSIDASDVIVSLLTATNIYEQIIRVENDYPYSTPINNSRDNDDNRTNDLITMESEVVRDLDGVHISIPIRLERGSVDNLTSTAIGFELVSDDECLDFIEMEFISDYSSGIMNVQTDNKLSTLMYDMNPIESNTVIEQLGELKFTVPLASSESSFTINGLVASGSNDEYDVINIDFHGNSVIEFNSREMIQKQELSNGANLGSFYSIPDDNSIGNMMLSIDDYVTGVIGEGVAASPNPVLGWVGSLANVSETSGYWIKVDNNILYESPIQSIQTYEDWIADIHIGANLMAYPCLLSSDIVSDDILSMPNQFEEFFHTGIIGEGVAAYYNPVLGWIGSLADVGLVPGNGYWMKSTEDFIGFNWECPELTCDQSNLRQVLVDYEIPEELEYVQSSQQAFYFISEIDLNQASINEGDWIVAMHDNNVVGARAWNGLFTDIPVMGFDSSDYSATYVENGKTPIFKLYKDGQMIDLFGDIPEFSNLGIHMISLSDVDPSIPSDFILEPAYPNPFNPSTTISYGVSEATNLNVSVYNIQGQQVDVLYDGFIEPGYYQKTWNASELSSGIYVVRMSSDTGFISNQKVVLVK